MSVMSESEESVSGTSGATSGYAVVAAIGLAVGGLLIFVGVVLGMVGIDSPVSSSVGCGSAFFPDSSPDASSDGQVGSLDDAAQSIAELGCPSVRTNQLILSLGSVGIGALVFMSSVMVMAATEAAGARRT